MTLKRISQQSSSIIDYIINDSALSKVYKVRGVTCDPSKPEALALHKKGVEVVKGDMDGIDSLKQAMRGAYTVFAATFTIYNDQIETRERAQGRALGDAAVAEGVQYLIFSTLPHTNKISDGVYTVPAFDVKAATEQYIRGLPLDSAFFSPGSFMQNYLDISAPYLVGDGTYAFSNIVSPQAPFPLIDVLDNTGNKATGKVVKYKQISVNDFKRVMPPTAVDNIMLKMKYVEDFGYYGSSTMDLVEWSARNARGKLTTLEEFFIKNPEQDTDHVYSAIAEPTNFSRITEFPQFDDIDVNKMLSKLFDLSDGEIPPAKRRKLTGRARYCVDVVRRLAMRCSSQGSKQTILVDAVDKSIEHTMNDFGSDNQQSDFVDKVSCGLRPHPADIHLVTDEPMVVEAVQEELKALDKDPAFLEYLDQPYHIVTNLGMA
ncbi:hypothetical protein BG015_005061 [Linnemannia schmuckeri]|uniref:NmrA-like domain-containing protein n=1 Tax=Linnemannia schmuckeri TaxID=64567 RepID=A0A9P5S117_9FUNG|nr:hypothetical protein BG015_005061 [Linnemannia schmuckeri]